MYEESYVVLHHALYMCPNDCVTCMQCAKQLDGSVLCGYYACDYLRRRREYSCSWRQLKKSTGWWRRQKVDKTIIKYTISDICKFVTDECCSVDGKVFNHESELATELKYKSLRNWRTELNMIQVTRYLLIFVNLCY